MSSTTALVIVGVIVLAVIILIVVGLVARMRGGFGGPKLKPLTPEARDRYGAQWDRVEARFVDDPAGAVRESDSILMGLLREREHPMGEEQLPARMKKARRLGSGREGKGGTEGMRQAMLEYRGVMEEYGRPADDKNRDRKPQEPDERREVAS